ncbi:MAG: LamG-like jellyroll fold domain-containing protein [Pirellulales bacterium]|nr:PEP-CTERM sorting domain-containing protein [Planctomycetales bacterium]
MTRLIRRTSAVAAALILCGFISTAQAQVTYHVYYPLGEGADGATSDGQLAGLATDTAVWEEITGANAGVDVDYTADIVIDGANWSSDTRGPQSDWSLEVHGFGGLADDFNAWWNTRVSSRFRIGVEAWIKPDPSLQGIGVDVPVVEDLVGLYIGADEKWHYANNGNFNTGNWDYVPGGEALADVQYGEWQHVLAWTTGSTWNLWVNGERITQDNTNNFSYGGSGPHRGVGADRNDLGDFVGFIDDAGFFYWDGAFNITETGYFTDLKPGDVDLDGNVDNDDYLIWRMNAGLDLSALSNSERRAHGDLNANGVADLADFRIIKENKTVAGSIVPEPTSVALIALGAFGVMTVGRRRREV